MEFYEDGDDIVSIWEPHENFQSWIGTLHGGIQATLMDELGGWVITRKLQTTGMTIRNPARGQGLLYLRHGLLHFPERSGGEGFSLQGMRLGISGFIPEQFQKETRND